MAVQNEKYWYLLSFMVQQPGLWTPLSIVIGVDNNHLTIPAINSAKEAYKVPEASVLMGASFLGYMTELQINGLAKPDQASDPKE